MKIATKLVILFAAILTYTTYAEVTSQNTKTTERTAAANTINQSANTKGKPGKNNQGEKIEKEKNPAAVASTPIKLQNNKPQTRQTGVKKDKKDISKKEAKKAPVNKKETASKVNTAPKKSEPKDTPNLIEFALPTIPVESGTLLDRSTRSDGKVSFEIPQAKEMEVPTKGFEGQNVPVLDALNALAHLAGINYVAPNVQSTIQTKDGMVANPLYTDSITFSLGDMDPYAAFKFIARTKGYAVHEEDGITYLTHPMIESLQVYTTKTYTIRHIDSRWLLEPVASLLGINLAQAGGPNGYGAMPDSNPAYPKSKEEGKNSGTGDSDSGNNSSSGSSGSSDAASQYTEFQTGELNARFTPALPLAQPIFLGGYNGGSSIFANRTNNTLVVRATESEHQMVAQFLKDNDIPEAQIQIDIKFIEVELTDRVQDGIDWSATLGNATFSMAPVTMDPSLFTSQALTDIWVIDPNAVIMNYPTAQATLRYLQTQKNAILSSAPRIVTKSGVPAAIEATVLESIEVYTIVNTTGVSQPVTSGTEQFATGVFMDVIATLTPSGHLQLNMNPTVSNKIGESIGSSGQVLPIISKRKATTTVTIAPSQTVVIGGLIQAKEAGDDTKVPILGDIPLLGYLFQSSDTERQKTSLLIFVTASIVSAAYDKAPTEEEYEILQRAAALQNTVDWKDKHGGSKSIVDEYTKYLQEREGSSTPKGVIDHNTADLPVIDEKAALKANMSKTAEEVNNQEEVQEKGE